MVFMGLVLSFMGGIGAIFVAESSDKRIRNPNVLTKLFKQTPLVVIPYIENKKDRRKKWLIAIAYLFQVGDLLWDGLVG